LRSLFTIVLQSEEASGEKQDIPGGPRRVCAVTGPHFPVGPSPTPQPLQPEAIGAVGDDDQPDEFGHLQKSLKRPDDNSV
jgi:hypothetical protein